MAFTEHTAVADDQIGPQDLYVDTGYVADWYVMGHVDPTEISNHAVTTAAITEH